MAHLCEIILQNSNRCILVITFALQMEKKSCFRNCKHTMSELLICSKGVNFFKYYIQLLVETRLLIIDISILLTHCLNAFMELKSDRRP